MRATSRRAGVLGLLAALAVACGGSGGGSGGGGGGGGGTTDPRLERYDAGFFSVEKPKGWSVTTAGTCETFAFLLEDPAQPLRQVFYFGTIGKIYTTAAQKAFDAPLNAWYLSHGQPGIPWADAPAVEPFTPANFLAHWPEIADMQGAAAFMADFPHLEGLELVSSVARPTMLPGIAASATGEARGVFRLGAKVGEGVFLASTVQLTGVSALLCTSPPSSPSGCTSWAFFVCGATAPEAELASKLELLVASLDSFTITQAYVDQCISLAQREFGAVAAAGRTLSEASDEMWDGWVARTHAEDVTAKEYRDGFLGVDRVDDPTSGTVYEVPVGWYAGYDAARGTYDLQDLALLPGEASYWNLWMKPTLDVGEIH